jgi:hypothetical protein
MAKGCMVRGLVAVSVILLLTSAGVAQPVPGPFSLRVQVVAPDAQGVLRPVVNADVKITAPGQAPQSVRANADGICMAPLGMSQIVYTVTVTRRGYRSRSFQASRDQARKTFHVVRREGDQVISVDIGDLYYRVELAPEAAAPPGVGPAIPPVPPLPGAKASLRFQVRYDGAAGAVRPIAGARVTLTQNKKTVAAGTTDATGRVTLQVPPGNYRADFRHAGYKPAWTFYDVTAAGGQHDVTLAPLAPPPPPPPPPALPLLRVRVARASDAMGVVGAEVVVLQKGVEVKRARCGADGMCSIPLAVGVYELIASASGFRSGKAVATVSPTGGSQQIVLQPR